MAKKIRKERSDKGKIRKVKKVGSVMAPKVFKASDCATKKDYCSRVRHVKFG